MSNGRGAHQWTSVAWSDEYTKAIRTKSSGGWLLSGRKVHSFFLFLWFIEIQGGASAPLASLILKTD